MDDGAGSSTVFVDLRFSKPPNYQTAKCCTTCAYWADESEGGYCNHYPSYIQLPGRETRLIYDGDRSTGVCDTWSKLEARHG